MSEVLEFKSNVGMVPTFFVARDGDEPPTATIWTLVDGETQNPRPLEVTETGDHPDFGARWCLVLPEPFWAEGDYSIDVSSGESYLVHVRPHTGTIRPDEAKRLAKLPIADQIEVLSTFVQPTEES